MRWFSRRSTPSGAVLHRLRRTGESPVPSADLVPDRPSNAVPEHEGPPQVGVVLGFADGSELHLPPADPRVSAFRAVASTLAQGRR